MSLAGLAPQTHLENVLVGGRPGRPAAEVTSLPFCPSSVSFLVFKNFFIGRQINAFEF